LYFVVFIFDVYVLCFCCFVYLIVICILYVVICILYVICFSVCYVLFVCRFSATATHSQFEVNNNNNNNNKNNNNNIWGFHSGDCEECRLLGYKNPVRTSQETHYVSATERTQLMRVWFGVFTAVPTKNAVFRDARPSCFVRTEVSDERTASIIRVERAYPAWHSTYITYRLEYKFNSHHFKTISRYLQTCYRF
jgi:hypothetical protein